MNESSNKQETNNTDKQLSLAYKTERRISQDGIIQKQW